MNGLKKTLKAQGRTTSWLAEQMGVTRTAAYHWTSGRTSPNDQRKRTISKLLGVSIEELFFSDNGGNHES